MRAQQEAFFKAMTVGFMPKAGATGQGGDDLSDIKKQLSELQDKLARMGK